MSTKSIIAGLLLAASVLPAQAADTSEYLGGSTVTGKVAGVYTRLPGGVYVAEELKAPEGQRWVEIRFAKPLANGRSSTTALIAVDEGVQRGDLVQIRIAHSGNIAVAPVREVNRVAAIEAKFYTAEAKNYGKPADPASRLLQQVAQAY